MAGIPYPPKFALSTSLLHFECRLYLGHRLGSTHYWYWDAQKRTFMHTRDWPFSPISESEVKEWYGNSKWKIEQ
ncbi:hypothetical protein [uncultured Prevotella sp.]|uniref:hypothetical protein n=1 Tax=uncultured Prevotella sp. TaxID=159272 RepID=UPI00266CC496|nr:hypothetical protein [uncultured Prevotella sp.]